jgi:UDP-N-acetylglucosamine--N-acetylmuramyl-(pentapeptide) pyrophosphoryl-undecaprenol N-acetylglucosamine transferase
MNPPRVDRGMRLLLPFSATAALVRAVMLQKKLQIHAVLGTGGYSSFFSIAAAWLLRRPAALLDSNAIPGRSNRIASRFCRAAFTGLPGGETGLKCPVFRTGIPVSSSLVRYSREEARSMLGLPGDEPVVLFLGGSQGARAINDMALGFRGARVLLQCGQADHERVSRLAEKNVNLIVKPFLPDLSVWYSAAELAVARAGGQTIAEMSFLRLPAVLVPFPFAAEDHQTANASAVSACGAGVLLPEGALGAEEFENFLEEMLKNKEQLEKMAEAMAGINPVNPAEAIVTKLREMTS